jgi:UDP-N-acetylmuramyl tripeptide synthase
VALRIAPDFIRRLSRVHDVVLVSGTNGKTTTTALLAAALGGAATNTTGSNMPAGHAAALADATTKAVVLETDEAWLGDTIHATSPRVIVLLNLSRDQLDRASEVRQLAERWRDAFQHTTATVIANANDPLVVYAASTAPRCIWVSVPTAWLADASSCPQCTAPLHIGSSWQCACGFAQPEVSVRLTDSVLSAESSAVTITLALPGRFNVANAALAAVAAAELDVPLADAVTRMGSVREVGGRFSLRRLDGVTIRLHLAKNPAGVAALLEDDHEWSSPMVVAINDELADGRDPSWLYDAPFERLRGTTVWCAGSRALDVRARLDYDDVRTEISTGELWRGAGPKVIDVIANYTAFQEWRTASTPC